MSNLLDNFHIYTKTFCNKLQNEVQKTFLNKEDTGGKVYVCAISRKTPKLLDILHAQYAQLNTFWDNMVIITEITLPFINWDNIKTIFLIDDAIYFGSTFSAIYKQIQKYAPHVKIVPMCCIRASEADLTFDDELRTTIVPRYVGHYFVNCLSIVFRKECTPFEVEFPVFRIEIPKGFTYKASRLFDMLKKTKQQVYNIDYQTGCSVKRNKKRELYNEIGINLAQDRNLCKKIRLYVRNGEILISSIYAQPIHLSDMYNDVIFRDTIYQDVWNYIRNTVNVKSIDDETKRSLCVAANFINSISVFFSLWDLLRNCINSAFGIELSKTDTELRIREINLLFGKEAGLYISQWYQSCLTSRYEQLHTKINMPIIEAIDTQREYLPKNLPFKKKYFEMQEQFLRKFKNTTGVMTCLFYIQSNMLDKKNRMFYAVNNERLKYGHTLGSLSYLKDKAGLIGAENDLEMHACVDAFIDAASIVPQYIKVWTNNMKEVWLRVFRSGENELHIVSHWARLSVALLKKEIELTGTQKVDIAFFSGMLTWIYDKYCLKNYFHDDAFITYSKGCYSVSVSIGNDSFDIVDVLEKLEIINVFRESGLLALNHNFFYPYLIKGSILPDSLMDKIDGYMESLIKDMPKIGHHFSYIPFFDAMLHDNERLIDNGSYPDADTLFERIFDLLEQIYRGESGDILESRTFFALQCKFLQIEFVAMNTHNAIWSIDDMENNRTVIKAINKYQEQISEKGFWYLIKTVQYAFADKDGKKLIKFTDSLKGLKFDFLKSMVSNIIHDGYDISIFLHEIILKGYQVWKF